MKYTYKQLISEKELHKIRIRARQLMSTGTDLIAIMYKDRKLVFKTASGTYGKKLIHTQVVEITDAALEYIQLCDTFKDVETLIKDSGLKVSCTCAAAKWWGVNYWAWKKGYGLTKETHYPAIRNPHGDYMICKHLYLVLSTFPFWSKALAKRFKNWADKKPTELPTGKFTGPRTHKLLKEQNKITPPSTPEEELEQELNNQQ